MPQLKNCSKGEALEKKISVSIHQTGTPLLLSSLVLRRYGGGQVDLAHVFQGEITLYEVKSSVIGVEASQIRQLQRLNSSLLLVENVTGMEVQLKYLKKDFAN